MTDAADGIFAHFAGCNAAAQSRNIDRQIKFVLYCGCFCLAAAAEDLLPPMPHPLHAAQKIIMRTYRTTITGRRTLLLSTEIRKHNEKDCFGDIIMLDRRNDVVCLPDLVV